MKPVTVMTVASVTSALIAAALVGQPSALGVLLGMAAPLAAVTVSWLLVERTYRRDPLQVNGLMIGAFGAKMLFFGVYVGVVIGVVGVTPVPFVASFTGYFVVLYVAEALLMRRLFAGR